MDAFSVFQNELHSTSMQNHELDSCDNSSIPMQGLFVSVPSSVTILLHALYSRRIPLQTLCISSLE